MRFGSFFTTTRVIAAVAFGFVAGLIFVYLDHAPIAHPVDAQSAFVYSFNTPGTLYEADNPADSTSRYWWVNSGAKLIIGNGFGETIQGALPPTDPWYENYASSNPEDTDSGAHPQNIFRLVTEGTWDNASEQASFFITNDNLSTSTNRNASNGLLLMTRYQDKGQTLYYAGVRVDGTAVIKKKYQESPGAFGTYFTMAQAQVFPSTYDASSSPDLLPHNDWLTLKLDTMTNPDGSVTLTLSMLENEGWVMLLTASDSGQYDDTPPITGASPDGIRTDFMDVEFKDFEVQAL